LHAAYEGVVCLLTVASIFMDLPLRCFVSYKFCPLSITGMCVSGHRLGGPPLCYRPCGSCLASWQHSVPLPASWALHHSAGAGAGGVAGVGSISLTTASASSVVAGDVSKGFIDLSAGASTGASASVSATENVATSPAVGDAGGEGAAKSNTGLSPSGRLTPAAAALLSAIADPASTSTSTTGASGASGVSITTGATTVTTSTGASASTSNTPTRTAGRSGGVTVDPNDPSGSVASYRVGCGYANGKEMLGYYTMAQTSFLLFLFVVVAMAVCLAWRVADEEKQERRAAAEWLKSQNFAAYELRSELIDRFGIPGSSVRPEGSAIWVFFGVTAALTFTLLGWHNWYVLHPSPTATLLILLNLMTILMSTLILHLSFFGRLLALYKRNFSRVEFLTKLLNKATKEDVDSWWNCRNFVLNDDLSLDYDIGGLAVSATFLITLMLFGTLISQVRCGYCLM
jgi:hypothetical protein